MNFKNAATEGVKELVRLVLLAALPVVISQVEAGRLDWTVILTVTALAVLKAVDKFVHEWSGTKLIGISPV